MSVTVVPRMVEINHGTKAAESRMKMAQMIRTMTVDISRRLGRPVTLLEIHCAIGQGDPYVAALVERAPIDCVRLSLSTASRRRMIRYAPVVQGGGAGGDPPPTYWGGVGIDYGPGWTSVEGDELEWEWEWE
jgi:hypothetical protein